jgi:hypothetical protein
MARSLRRVLAALFLLALAAVPSARAQVYGLQNGDFELGLTFWDPISSPDWTIGWDTVVGGVPTTAISVDRPSVMAGVETYFLSQCARVKGNTTYDLSGSFRFPSTVTAVPVGSIVVRSYSTTDCTGASLPGISSFGLSGALSPADTWLTANYTKGYTTPPAAVATQVLLRVTTPGNGAFHAWFDSLSMVESPLAFYSIDPCRVIDTRGVAGVPLGGPALVAHNPRNFAVVGNCGIPTTARALSVNIVATQSTEPGNIRIYSPALGGLPEASTLNYSAGQTRANNAILALDSFGVMTTFVDQIGGSTVHFILDVNGYFR